MSVLFKKFLLTLNIFSGETKVPAASKNEFKFSFFSYIIISLFFIYARWLLNNEAAALSDKLSVLFQLFMGTFVLIIINMIVVFGLLNFFKANKHLVGFLTYFLLFLTCQSIIISFLPKDVIESLVANKGVIPSDQYVIIFVLFIITFTMFIYYVAWIYNLAIKLLGFDKKQSFSFVLSFLIVNFMVELLLKVSL